MTFRSLHSVPRRRAHGRALGAVSLLPLLLLSMVGQLPSQTTLVVASSRLLRQAGTYQRHVVRVPLSGHPLYPLLGVRGASPGVSCCKGPSPRSRNTALDLPSPNPHACTCPHAPWNQASAFNLPPVAPKPHHTRPAPLCAYSPRGAPCRQQQQQRHQEHQQQQQQHQLPRRQPHRRVGRHVSSAGGPVRH